MSEAQYNDRATALVPRQLKEDVLLKMEKEDKGDLSTLIRRAMRLYLQDSEVFFGARARAKLGD